MIEVEHELRGKHILVTGASGFIGSRLVQLLLNHDTKVVALVEEDASLARIEPLLADPGLHLIRCDLTDMHTLSAQRQKWGEIDLIAHLGLRLPSDGSFCGQSIENITKNVLPTMNLIRTLGESIQGICFASSVSVYGYPAGLPVRESDLPAPFSSYGATKLAIEDYLRAYGRTTKVPVTVLRFTTVYGPGEFRHRAIPNFLHNIVNGQPPVIHGDGSEIRDYVYIDDVVHAIICALAKRPAQVFNIGSGKGYTVLHIAQEVIKLCSVDIKPQFIPAERQNLSLTCDISAAGEALSYSPQTSIEEGLTREIEWFKKQVQDTVPEEKNEHIPDLKNQGRLRRLFHYSFWKSAADRLMALLGITILSPLLALIAVGIKLDSHKSPIFAQERVGKDGRKFLVYKFRTMHNNNDDSTYKEYLIKYVLEDAPYRVDQNGQGIYKVDNSQVTRFGALLRKTNLDELPQLFNVLKGEMSLIGPRPDVPFAVSMYKTWHRQRLSVKPGITGLWQVSRRKELSFNDMVRFDIDYIQRQSPILDARIALFTIGTVLRGDGS